MSFYLSSGEQREVRDLAQVFFNGGNPAFDCELADTWRKWKTLFDAFMISLDARHGNILHLPYSGGTLEQGAKTMEVFLVLQTLYREKLDREQKKALSHTKRIRK